ncbi:hypothetical protein SODALDRAFT_324935 [Sodiomyces alkalinus F11]|uniref:Cytoskeleton-associated protein n=1 Tax=Sodiomyces alkalinus (strain CBS 110278 / VKM F-3762 / F11) TaxID=1314773 RepID=A0A3N2PS39_SODAK|nr:hypothetical protein SODALDRAFT_324935 [Sodiomyces alkalinus F11]ROT37308.1 hypothetical protein SODALDRAFT_324935 [Sodiomyces alkalinus F11]
MFYSGLLRFFRDDRVILAGIGITTFTMVSVMTQALVWARDENEVKPTPPKTQYITQDTEDALQLETLDKLVAHPNYSIRDIATKILCDRAVNDNETIHYLLYNITRPDYDTRIQSLHALATLLCQNHGECLSKMHNWRGYTALVRSLELSFEEGEHPKLDDRLWDDYYLRDMAEKFCLSFIVELVNRYDADMLVRAKFVEKWLAKQNWGETERERRENFLYYVEYRSNRIVDIITKIARSHEGSKALVACKLAAQSNFSLSSEAAFLVQPTLRAVDFDDDQTGEQMPRNRDHSDEEQRLRRQHREAMVFNDGTRPIGREDIIERSEALLS